MALSETGFASDMESWRAARTMGLAASPAMVALPLLNDAPTPAEVGVGVGSALVLLAFASLAHRMVAPAKAEPVRRQANTLQP